MGTARVPLLKFNGGEIGARTLARVDLTELYPACAETMENCWASVQGPLSKVPGSEHFGTTPSNAVAILRPFVFDEDDAVLLELSNLKMRFWDPDDGLITLEGAAATVGNFSDQSTGGSSVTTGTTSTTFTNAAGGKAKARSSITTAAPNDEVTLTFSVTRRPVTVRIGTSAGGEEVVTDTVFYPGVHILTFTPTASPYYFQAQLSETGAATLDSLTRLAAGTLELTTPWAEASLPDLRYEQQRDAMWWYIGSAQTRVLERRGRASWSLRYFQPEDGPFDAANTDSAVTVTSSGLSGSVTLTASEALFETTDAGRLIRITHPGQTVTDAFTATNDLSDDIRVTGVGDDRIFTLTVSGTFSGGVVLQRSIGNDVDFADYGSPYSSATTVAIDDGLDNQTIYYRLRADSVVSGTIDVTLTYSRGSTTGYARIRAYSSTTSVSADVYEAFGKTTAASDWALGAWNDLNGWPIAGTLFDGRHWLVREDRVFGSVADDYESFLIGSDASAAVDRLLATGDVNDARWIEGASRLLIGTSGAAVEVRASSFDEPITPDNMNARSIANKGKGSAAAQSEKIDKRVVYIGKNRKRLLQLVYDVNENAYAPDDLTRLHKTIAGELAADGFVEISIQYEPEPRIWAIREDGEIGVLTFAPEENVYAWSRFSDDGEFESVCCLPGSPEDSVFLVVKRTIDGQTVRHVEKLATEYWENMADAWRLRDALATANPADNIITGLTHLEGEEVYAWADGRIQGPFTVDSGSITLADDDYDYVIVGLNYTGLWKSAKLSYGAQLGTALCQTKSFKHIGLITNRCAPDSFKYGRGTGEGEYNTWPTPDALSISEEALNEPLPELSRDDWNGMNSGDGTDPRLHIIMDTPAPVEILGAVIEIDTQG